MMRLAIATAVLCASCATKPPTTADLLLGSWTCESKPSFGTIKATTTYSPDGKAKAQISVAGSGGALAVEAAGDVEATWKLVEEDAKIEQSIAGVTITSAKLNGQDVDPGMAQAMIAPYLAGQSATSAVKVDKTSLTLTSADSVVTACSR